MLKDILEEFILELQIQNYSPRTMKGYRNNNLLMLNFIEKEFGIEEIEKVKPVHIKAYILFDTGIRCLELCSITNGDVKENNLIIKYGKGNKQRIVAISPYVKRLVLRYIKCRDNRFKDRAIDKNTPFFLSYRFRELTVEGVERVVKICGQKANIRKDIRCSPHTCRHYFAQAQLRNGLDVYSLSRLLGHENITITKRYLQSINDRDIVEMSVKTSPLMNLRK